MKGIWFSLGVRCVQNQQRLNVFTDGVVPNVSAVSVGRSIKTERAGRERKLGMYL